MADIHELLHRYWGYDTFRPPQEEIVASVVQGFDVLAVLPTGGGKTLCYQLPALLREGLCLVVSPLVALMKAQVEVLQGRGLKAACLTADLGGEATTRVLYNAVAGELKYLYVSPERLRQARFVEHLRRMRVGLIAVDEAHCVSQWGYDFRPPYLQIADIRAYHPAAPLIALTATATPAVEEDICRQLLMRRCRRFRTSIERANLTYRVWREEDKQGALVRLLQSTAGSAIVYVRSRRLTERTAEWLCDYGIGATCYHAGLTAEERDRRQALWMEGGYRVMVATNAFGMGIDKGDVRTVVHWEAPDSLEAYVQEAGRAGRDGQAAEAVLLYGAGDDERLRRYWESDFPTLQEIRNVYRALCNHYRLPMGSGADTRHRFDLAALCEAYHLEPRRCYSACRFLEREGLIALPEQETASTLRIAVARDELYRFAVNHHVLGELLLTLIRQYAGLFDVATPIDEGRVASRCQWGREEVERMLTELQAMRVVEYQPRIAGPQIVFTASRIDERALTLGDESYRQLKAAAERRLQAMLSYLHSDDEGRRRILKTYFGEV